MPVVSVTRLRLASPWSLPAFLVYAALTSRQTRRSPGFLAGWLGNEPPLAFWTSTVWQSADAVRAFRASGAHLKAMPKLLRWCDEAAFARWEQPDDQVPDATCAYERLAREGRLSNVFRPSGRQRAGETVGHEKPRPVQRLHARRGSRVDP